MQWREVERYLAWDGFSTYQRNRSNSRRCTETYLLEIPFSFGRGSRKLCLPIGPRVGPAGAVSPGLVGLLRKARKAQHLVDTHRTQPLGQLATRICGTESHFVRLLRLNYLAPDIITAIVDGKQPAEAYDEILLHTEIPLDWALQRVARILASSDWGQLQAVSRRGRKMRC